MEFGPLIRSARRSLDLRQADVAVQVGCSTQAIWKAENGLGTVALLERIAAALGVKIAGMPTGRTLADRVKAARLQKGWSRRTLSEKAVVSLMAIYRLENGNARMKTLEAVIGVLAPQTRVAEPRWKPRVRHHRDRDRRFTPPGVLDRLNAVVGEFELDAAADRDSPVVARRYFYEEDDGLQQPWTAKTVYVNPPYSQTTPFIRKAFAAWKERQADVILMLLPARTQLHSFHDCVAGHADVFLLKERIAFMMPDGGQGRLLPFPHMLVLYGADEAMVERAIGEFESAHIPARDRRTAIASPDLSVPASGTSIGVEVGDRLVR